MEIAVIVLNRTRVVKLSWFLVSPIEKKIKNKENQGGKIKKIQLFFS